ncbi:MAG: hypothetical protein HFG20_00410 [Anaerotruncus sp.]|jgi:hypothetical protein|nr:hypothetical protein [Anaerotruncus sp.]
MNHLMFEIAQKLHETYPQLEIAAFDTASSLLCSYPDPLHRKLSSNPHPPKMIRNNHFTAAIEVANHGALAFGGRILGIPDVDTLYCFVKSYIKVLQEKESICWRLNVENDPCSVLLKSLFSISSEEDLSYVTLSAAAQGYDLALPRVIILIECSAPDNGGRLLDSSMAVLPASIKELPFFSQQDMVGWSSEHQIVICKALEGLQEYSLRDLCAQPLHSLCELLQAQYHLPAQISVSPIVQQAQQYATCLTLAQKTLSFSKMFEHYQSVHFYDDYLLETEVSQLPPKVLEHFFAGHVQAIKRSSWMAETLDALIRNNMALDETAQSLYIHRNTLAFRLRQIRKTLRLDPVNCDSDYFTLMVLNIYLHSYNRNIAKESK